MLAFQDQIPYGLCFGYGANPEPGFKIQSYWSGNDRAICTFQPSDFLSLSTLRYLSSGVIAALIDYHCLCSAIAMAYQQAERQIGEGEPIRFFTDRLSIEYLHPVPVDQPVELLALFESIHDNKILLSCILSSGQVTCAEGEVETVRVPDGWPGLARAGR